ncbi:MAG: hypothetical protein AB1491_10420 [Thermodesulfobacteriota bacterium]
MNTRYHLKTLRDLISHTPLVIDQTRDSPRFQDALTHLPNPKLKAFYQGLNAEKRRRFHYVANVCLGYESWTRLYKELVVQETQERLADRMEEAYASKLADLRQQQENLEAERQEWQEEVLRLEGNCQGLCQENLDLREELHKTRQEYLSLQEQHQQLLKLLERYQALIADLRLPLPESPWPGPPKT